MMITSMIKRKKMKYPDFVKLVATDAFNESRILDICGQRYKAVAYDYSIDRAIELATYWQVQQVSYTRIVHLRNWIRDNEELQVPEVGMKSMLGCKEFVDRVIVADFVAAGGRNREAFMAELRENERVFFEEEFISTA